MEDADLRALVDGLHPLEVRLLAVLLEHGEVSFPGPVLAAAGLEDHHVRTATEWLRLKETLEVDEVVTGYRGELLLADWGVPAVGLYRLLLEQDGLVLGDLPEEAREGVGVLKKERAVEVVDGCLRRGAAFDAFGKGLHVRTQDLVRTLPRRVTSDEAELLRPYSRRRGKGTAAISLDPEVVRKLRLTDVGRCLAEAARACGLTGDEVSDLTPEMLKDGSARTARFRRYNIGLPAPRLTVGRRHPYRQFLDGVRRKLVSLGFEEMTGPLVESEFWDMDALFMPQFHSARDIHDALYLKTPTHARPDTEEEPVHLVQRVAVTHQDGGDTGSRGWRYPFDERRTLRLLLRTQGTALSARTLAAGPRIPGKYFGMARCCRHDQVDATHAAEFFQVEGIVLGEGIHFRHLLGLLDLFAREMAGAKAVKFLPAYFPFTEPSVEVHVEHPDLGWMELGGAGIFRPEVTLPLGVSVPVIAWGLGLDRMAMVALGIDDIRNLFSQDLSFLREKRIPVR